MSTIRIRQKPWATAVVVALALFTDMLIYGLVIPILPSMLTQMGLEVSENAGLLVAAYAFGLLIFTPFVGYICDKYEGNDRVRKFAMLFGLFGLGLSTVLFGFVDLNPEHKISSFWQLAIARFCQGVSGGCTWTIGLALIADVYPQSTLGTATGYVMAANVAGQLLGPPVGGFLWQYGGQVAPFIFAGGLALIDLIGRLWVQPVKYTDREYVRLLDERDVQPVVKLSMVSLITAPPLILAFSATIALATAFSGMEPTLPLHLPIAFPDTEKFKMTASVIGLMMTCIVVPNILVAIVAGWLSDRYSRTTISGVGMLLSAASLPFIALPHASSQDSWGFGIYLEIIALMSFGATSAVAITPILPEIASYITSRGGTAFTQVYALFNIAYSLGMLFGPIVAGYMYLWIGFAWNMVLFSVLIAVVGVVQLVSSFKEHRYMIVPDVERSVSRASTTRYMSSIE